MQNLIKVLVVGSTGKLGQLITKNCFNQQNLEVSVLVRNPDKNKELVEQVIQLGGKVVVGDVTKSETLKDCTKGIHTVISALAGDDSVIVNGQKALLEDAVRNGVQRFVASDFCADYRKLDKQEKILAFRIQFREELAKSPIKPIHILNGAYTETFWWGFTKKTETGIEMNIWGDENIPQDMTTYDDVAKFTAAVVSDPNSVGDYEIVGSKLSPKQVCELYTNLTGKTAKYNIQGNFQDLLKARENHPTKSGFAYFILGVTIPIVDGRAELHHSQHEKFGVKPVTLEEYLKTRSDL